MSESRRPRRALVLGAGGVVGSAWMVGALRAMEESCGWDPRRADVFQGTSAGAVLAALLAAGVSTERVVDHQRGGHAAGDPLLVYDHDHATGGRWPRLPRPRLGSPRLLRRGIRRLHRNPLPVGYACLPEGRGELSQLGNLMQTLYPEPEWPVRPILRVVAMDYDTGERAVFGGGAAPRVSVRQAVTSSCAAPGWFAPVCVDGRRYVDGGVYSVSSLDLLPTLPVDEAVVLCPMAALRYDRARSPQRRIERRWRRMVSRRVLTEVDTASRAGVTVRLLVPGPEDLGAFGANLMDPAKRLTVLETSLRTTSETLARAAFLAPRPVG